MKRGQALLLLGVVLVLSPNGRAADSTQQFFGLEALACLDEMRTVGHAGFSYSASLDAFVVEGARAGKPGFYYAPVAPSRGTSLQPRVYFLDAQAACPEAKIKRREKNDIGICVVQAAAATQPVEFILNVHSDRYRGFASRPHHLVGRAIASDARFQLPEVTREDSAGVALERSMTDWIEDRITQLQYFLSVLNPDGNRQAERTVRLVETARSAVTSLEPVVRVCGSAPGSQLQAALKPLSQSHRQLKDFVEDAEDDIQRSSTRKPAGFAP
jgi:hypothetical protein